MNTIYKKKINKTYFYTSYPKIYDASTDLIILCLNVSKIMINDKK